MFLKLLDLVERLFSQLSTRLNYYAHWSVGFWLQGCLDTQAVNVRVDHTVFIGFTDCHKSV